MGVTGTENGLTKPTGRIGRLSKKKRRTEISSSEESSSSSSSESEDEDEDDQKSRNVLQDKEAETTITMEIDEDIDHLEVPSKEKSNRDVLETRLKLSAIQNNISGLEKGSISEEEWVGAMISQYGEDIDLLRRSADFKDGSVAQVAQLLRESRHVI